MSASGSSVAAGLVMVIAGMWLLLQTLVGGLASRIAGLSGGSSSGPSASAIPSTQTAPGTSASANPTPAAAAGAKKAGIPTGRPNTTDPTKPIFIAPSGQGISGFITP